MGTYLSARYVGPDPDLAENGPDAVLSDMADHWMSEGREGRWPDSGWSNFTVRRIRGEDTGPDEDLDYWFIAVFPHQLFGTLEVGCIRPASMYARAAPA